MCEGGNIGCGTEIIVNDTDVLVGNQSVVTSGSLDYKRSIAGIPLDGMVVKAHMRMSDHNQAEVFLVRESGEADAAFGLVWAGVDMRPQNGVTHLAAHWGGRRCARGLWPHGR